jgi:hypothetical protein
VKIKPFACRRGTIVPTSKIENWSENNVPKKYYK